MIKTKPEVGAKVRCVDTGGYSFLTKGKVYEVCEDVRYYACKFWYKDDDGGYMVSDFENDIEQFEIVEEVKEDKQMNKESLFKVGDVVWDLIYGKGVVKRVTSNNDSYPVTVKFDVDVEDTFTQEGKRYIQQASNRTLFFSEPKIEALKERPFVPTLVGKKVVIEWPGALAKVVHVYNEDSVRIYTTPEGNYWIKDNLEGIYEVSTENLISKI